jgi:hypothetical protein
MSQTDALTHVPEALLRASLLPPDKHQVRSLMADGSTKHNAPFLALLYPSQLRRKALVLNVSESLGDNMVAWHSALHRPQQLPESAFDWSTVLLQEMLDIVWSPPGDEPRFEALSIRQSRRSSQHNWIGTSEKQEDAPTEGRGVESATAS